MATIKCSVTKNTLYEVYIEYSVSQNPIAATSTITHALKLKQLKDGYDFNGYMDVTYKIGSTAFTYTGNYNIDDKGDAGSVFTIKTGAAVVIQHDKTTGKGSFTVECSGSCPSGGYGPGDITLAKQTVTLSTIDRVAPNVTISVSQVTTKSLNITATSHAVPDKWEYSIDDGKTWVEFSTSKNKTVSTTVTGLSPNTTYEVKVRARREYNQVSGVSSSVSVKTIGNSLLNSVSDLVVNVDNPVLTMNWTVYDDYNHMLTISDGSTTVLYINNLTCTVGTNNKSITLTERQKEILLDYMCDKQSFDATFSLVTKDSSNTPIGDASTRVAEIQVSNKSAPVITEFDHFDTNASIETLTTSQKKYIKGHSTLQVTVESCDTFDGATIASYRVSVGSQVKDFDNSSTILPFGKIDVSGDNVTLRVEVFDSRGFSAYKDTTIEVYDYEQVSITEYSARRVNEIEATIKLNIVGKYSPIVVTGVDKNAITSLKVQYSSVKGSLTTAYDITPEWSNGSFSFSTSELTLGGSVVQFDADMTYYIVLTVTDKLTSDTVFITVNKGKPLVAYRSKKVGINEANPKAALHIQGEGDHLRLANVRLKGLSNGLGIATEDGDEYGFVDYIEESNIIESNVIETNGAYWYYEKRHSGIAECWGSALGLNVNCNKEWGVLYETSTLGGFDYPLTFSGAPLEFVTVHAFTATGDVGVMLEHFASNTNAKTGTVCLVRPKSITGLFVIINYHIWGYWK